VGTSFVSIQLEVVASCGFVQVNENSCRVDDGRQPDNEQMDRSFARTTTVELAWTRGTDSWFGPAVWSLWTCGLLTDPCLEAVT